jgi:hypothetical protein
LAADDVKRTSVPPRPIDPTSKLTVPEIKPEQLPAISSPEFKDASEDSKTFENIRQGLKQVDTTQKMAAEREKIRKAAQRAAVSGPGGPPGGRNSPGAGGGTGGGIGTGTGPNIGPGGGGDPFGRPATPQEIHAYRWRIYLSPDIEQHVRTLIAMRVTYVFEANGRQYKVLDLRRTPVELVAIPPINHREVVAWEQTNFGIMRALAQRLKLKFWPSKGIITLPTDVEEKLATVEREAAQRQGRPLETIRFTNFDVKLVNGVYEPYVTGFE